MNKHVWVVEIWEELPMRKGCWTPVVGIGLDRAQGRLKMRQWKERNPDDKFRVIRYERTKNA